tara:strand:+ start:2963 stop:5041 length:2079 start_codon:yes stop_codon:yes gene_type:complete
MIEESLIKSNFLGRDGFIWWVGQIAPEEAQGAQINGGGLGNRFKVRILGYHPYDEATLENDDLPWAQVLLSPTDGSGRANRATSVKLSPGDNVFGFFLDGDDAQQPVIMGVFGGTLTSEPYITEKFKNPFQPFKGYTSKITNDGAYIINRESNEANTKSQVSPRHVPVSILPSLGEDARTAYNAIGSTVVAATPSQSSAVQKISGEVNNLVSKIQSITGGLGSAVGAISGKVSKLIDGVTSSIKGISKGLVNSMTNNLFSKGLAPVLKGGLGILYKTVYGQVLSATGKTSFAKRAGAAAQGAIMPAVKAMQNILPCLTSKIMDGLGGIIKQLLKSVADNVSNFVSCIADQFVGGLFNSIVGGITSAMSGVMGGVGKLLGFMGGFDIGGFLRGKAEGLLGLVGALTCDTSEPTFNKKTGEWTIGKGPKNIIGVSVDAIVKVANAADKLVEDIVGGIQGISVASGSLGMFDFLNPSVSNPGFKSGLGECYAGPPLNCAGLKVNIFGGGGTQALGKAIMGSIVGDNAAAVGSLIGIDLVSGGSGYTTPPYVEITDNCNKGVGAIARAVIDQDEDSSTYQQVTDIYIVSEGEGYPIPDDQDPVVVDHIVIVNPGQDYDSDDTITDGDTEYTIRVDGKGHIVDVFSPDNSLLNQKEIEELPLLTVNSKTGYGAVLKAALKVKPTYQGEVKQVIDCVS